MAPKVYFTDFATRNYETLPKKLARLILTAGMDKIDFEGKFVAIKIHFGELGNMAHLRSGNARVLVDIIKDLGGKPSSPMPIPCTSVPARTPWIIWKPHTSTASPPTPPAPMSSSLTV